MPLNSLLAANESELNMKNLSKLSRFVILGLTVLFFTILLAELSTRIIFPWDTILWPESPFMTNMMKLDSGMSVFSPPEDANSTIYSPGIEYVSYFLLKPLEFQLDIRFSRLVTVFLGFLAAFIAAMNASRLGTAMSGFTIGAKQFLFTYVVCCLLLFKNVTSDVPHPDNLHILHALVVLLMGYTSIIRRNFYLALFTMALAGLGVLIKQNAMLSFVGAGIGLLIGARWGILKSSALVLVGIGVFAASLSGLMFTQFGKFHLFDLVVSQSTSSAVLQTTHMLKSPHHLVLLCLAVLVFPRLARIREEKVRAFLLMWGGVGIAEALPGLAAYLKINAAWNNLGIIMVWLFIIVWPFIGFSSVQNITRKSRTGLIPLSSKQLAAISLLVISLIPLRLPPESSHYRFYSELESSVVNDVRQGKRVLVPHGTMLFLRNGLHEVPLDRAMSYLEYSASGKESSARTIQRIKDKFYDVIYMDSLSWLYGPKVLAAIAENYKEVHRLCLAENGDQQSLLSPISCPVVPWHRRLMSGHIVGWQCRLIDDVKTLCPRATSAIVTGGAGSLATGYSQR